MYIVNEIRLGDSSKILNQLNRKVVSPEREITANNNDIGIPAPGTNTISVFAFM